MTMSRLVTMGVVAVVFVVRERCDAVCLRGQPPPSPSLGLSPLSAVGTTSVLTPWDRLPLPSLTLPAWGARACVYERARTHIHILPLMRVLLFDVQSGSLAGSLYLGERGRLVPRGAKEGQGIPGRELGGHHNPCPLQEQLLLPIPESRPHAPTPTKRWPLFTVRTRSLCLLFLKYKL